MAVTDHILPRLRRTLQSIFRIGSIQVKDNSGVAEVRDSSDSAYVDFKAAVITATSIQNTPIGTTTANSGYFSALRLIIGGFAGIFTHANTVDRTYTFPNYDGTVATLAGTETLSGKTLTTPTISATGWTNANHAHTAANSGGTLDAAAIASGVLGAARVPIIPLSLSTTFTLEDKYQYYANQITLPTGGELEFVGDCELILI